MTLKERIQLRDEVIGGTVSVRDLSFTQLRAMKTNFDMSYQPSFEFFLMIDNEIRRRETKTKIKFDRRFYG